MEKLESFLGEMSKRLLQLPRWYNNTPATVICGFQSITSHCLCRKLNYLHKLTSEERSGNIGNETFKALLDDVESICLVRECRELERKYELDFTTAILNDPSSCSVHERKKAIMCKDHDLQLNIHKDREDMRFVTEVETVVGWSRLWDMALDHGYKCIDGVRNLVRVMVYPEHALKPCPLCAVEKFVEQSLLHHVLQKHSNTTLSGEQLLNSLFIVSDSESLFFTFVSSLYRLF